MRSYIPILDLDLYENVKIDELDSLTRTLEVLRQNIHHIVDLPNSAEIDLISLGNPHGDNYPAVAIHCTIKEDFEKLPHMFDLSEMVNNWFAKNQIVVKNLSRNISFSWEQLDSIGKFPQR